MSDSAAAAPITCVFCSLSFPSYTTLQDHFELSHNVPDPESNNSNAAPNIKCFLCPTEFDTFETAGKHYVFNHKLFHIVRKKKEKDKENVRKYSCQMCQFSSDAAADLADHFKAQHGGKRVNDEQQEQQQPQQQQQQLLSVRFKCASCEFVAATPAKVRDHMKATHATVTPAPSSGDCSNNSNSSSNSDNNSTSNNSGSAVVKYKCNMCPFTCTNKVDVREHCKVNHSAEKRPLMPKLSSSNVNRQPVPSTTSNSSTTTQYKCGLCSLTFLTVEDARIHWTVSHQEQTPKAPKTNPSGQSLKNQDKRKQNLGVIKSNCQLCKFTCTSPEKMNEHLVETHMFLSCSECHSLCPNAKALVDHTVMVHNKDKEESADVEMEQDMEDVAATEAGPSHITQNHSSNNSKNVNNSSNNSSDNTENRSSLNTCTHCGLRFYSSQGLQVHIEIAHKSAPAKKKEEEEEEDETDDDDDDVAYQEMQQQQQPRKTPPVKKRPYRKIKTMPQKCGLCKLVFGDVKIHFQQEHNTDIEIDKKFNKTMCIICKDYYPSRNSLKEHIALEHKEEMNEGLPEELQNESKLFPRLVKPCRICSQLLPTEKLLMKHFRQRHPGQSPAWCDVCQTGFHNQNSLRDHMETHEPHYQPHQCPQCPKLLRTQNSLKRHIRSLHTEGVMPPKKCDLCDKTFRWHAALKRHRLAVHSTSRVHCDQCPRHFKAKVYLDFHTATCHNSDGDKEKKNKQQQQEKAHLCFLCGYSCYSSTSLKGHLKRHEEGDSKFFPRNQRAPRGGVTKYSKRPLPCEIGECKKRFRKEFWRERHWKLDHGVGDWVRKKAHYGGATAAAAVAIKKKSGHYTAVAMKEEEEYEEESEEDESD